MAKLFGKFHFSLVLAAATFLVQGFYGKAEAFHSGGVGDCSGCHSLHNSAQEQEGNPFFLIASDPGSTCLTCHMSAGGKIPSGHFIATADQDMPPNQPPVHLTPGGDFGWLKKNYQWGGSDGFEGGQSPGDGHGHNIVAADYGYAADSTLTEAPGGTYPAASMSCISCHDPHGKYRRDNSGAILTGGAPIRGSGSYTNSVDPDATFSVGVYRLLGGVGYRTSSAGGNAFTAGPPSAVCPPDYNRTEDSANTMVAYGSGMSEWCTNCHNAYAGTGKAPGHPAGSLVKMTPRLAANYNAYIASGNVSGNYSASYTSLVPFEMGTSDYSTLKGTANRDGSKRAGPDASSSVMCLTCHRAHASAWDKATRWNMKTEFIVYNGVYPGVDRTDVPARYSQGRTNAETRRAFYERPAGMYATYQRSLCNKCHTMD